MRREARLKPEYAYLYPGLAAGAWESAAVLADKVMALRLLRPNLGFLLSDRALPDAHFEFRGGSTRGRSALPLEPGTDPRVAQLLSFEREVP